MTRCARSQLSDIHKLKHPLQQMEVHLRARCAQVAWWMQQLPVTWIVIASERQVCSWE